MKKVSIHIFILTLCLIISNVVSGQVIHSARNKKEANTHIEQLRKGVLIVQIATQDKKVEQLEKMVRSNPSDKRLRKMLAETIAESDDLLEATIRAYNSNFDFSKVVFMPDTMVKRLFAGERTGLFLDISGKLDATIKLETADFYICYIGLPASNTGKKSLVIIDDKGNNLGRPFPYAVTFYTLGNLIVGSSDAESVEDAVIKQNKKLKWFLKKVRLKELNEGA